MTANELADELDKSRQKPYTSEHLVGKAANMLRQFGLAESIVKQQQLEIEALKDKLMLAKLSLEIVEGWTKK